MDEFVIQFKNKHLTGSEIQIRSFYYQLFWQILPREQIKSNFFQPAIGNLIIIFENQFKVKFNPEQYSKLVVWIGIMHKRLDYRKIEETNFNYQILEFIEADPLYQQIKNILARYLSRFAFQWSQEEILFLYLFFLSEDFFEINHEMMQQSPFVSKMITINQKIGSVLLETNQKMDQFQAYLVKQHVRIAFSKGWLEPVVHQAKLLSDMDAEKMSQCMSIIEENISETPSNSQWRMLDQAYRLIIDIYRRQQQSEFYIGLALSPSLQSLEYSRFIRQQLAHLGVVTIETARKNQVYDVLIADEYTDRPAFSYKQFYLSNGQTTQFEANRVKKVIQDHMNHKGGS